MHERSRALISVLSGILFLVTITVTSAHADAIFPSRGLTEELENARAQCNLELRSYRATDSNNDLFGVQNFAKQSAGSVTMEALRRSPGRVFTPGFAVVSNPEPATMLLLGTGLAILGGYVRRRHKAVKAVKASK